MNTQFQSLLIISLFVSIVAKPPPSPKLSFHPQKRKAVSRFSKTTSPTMQYKFFKASYLWPLMHCVDHNCAQYPSHFVFNGFWPEGVSQTDPNDPIDLRGRAINKNTKELIQYWPDLSRVEGEFNYYFYEYQYERHGLYCNRHIQKEKYFELALRLAQKYNISHILEEAGFSTSEEELHTYSTTLGILEAAIGFMPEINCRILPDKRNYIREIHICINRDGKTAINCEHPGYPNQCNGMNDFYVLQYKDLEGFDTKVAATTANMSPSLH